MPLVALSPEGLYCEAGRFHVDPWRGVDRAIVTHAHADHARPGSRTYLASAEGEGVLRERVGADASIDTLAWGESRAVNGVRVSMHPAGHILGSAQVRLEYRGQVCVVSGDYRDAEPVRCHTFISESTFGLPIYRWRPESEIVADICAWWDANRADGKTSVLFAYALGKAQRILAGLVPCKAPVLVHGAVARFLPHYAAAGIEMPATRPADLDAAKETRGEALVIAPPSAFGTTWLRKFKPCATAFASGWMTVRGPRRRRGVDRGFALSDHADWDGLLRTIEATEADEIGVTHGYTGPLVRWLTERGKRAYALPTRFEGEVEE